MRQIFWIVLAVGVALAQHNFQTMPLFAAAYNPIKACHPGMQVEFR